MEGKSSIVFLLLMFARCILYCQSGRIIPADDAVMTQEPMTAEIPEAVEPVQVGISTDQPEDCELSGPIQEEISSLKERVALLLAALTQHFGDDFQLGAPTDVTRAELPHAEQPLTPDSCDVVACADPHCDPGFVIDYSIGCCGACVIDLCADAECDELPCPEDVQYTPFGCCPLCPEDWGVPPCVISGTCTVEPTEDPCNGIICDVPQCGPGFVVDYSVGCCGACVIDLCADTECNDLPCPEDVQHTYPGNCCPECPQDWGIDPCQLGGGCETATTNPPVPDDCIRPCILIYDPVCGSDGKTYPNQCVFESQNCKNLEVTSEPGACESDPCDLVVCDPPQCGPGFVANFSIGCCGACVEDPCADAECDELSCPEDVQYTPFGCCPQCPADWGVPPCVIAGTCTPAEPSPTTETDLCIRPCILIYDPVCGSDGKTYPNQCVFESQNCENPEVTSEPGACPVTESAIQDPCADTECDELPCPADLQHTYPGNCCPECPQDWGLDPCELSGTCTIRPTAIIDPDSCGKPCHRIYRPVCGSDGNTYANECLFEIEKCKNPELTSEPGACSETPIVIDPCVDVECDELPCPEDVQYTIGCCPECPADWGVPPCVISGTCAVEPTEAIQDPCADTECDELPCPADLQHTYPGNCCPECPQDWGLDPCELSGTCTIRPTAIIDPDSCGKPCHRIYRPVCGSDGNTYANECVFEIEKCKNPELTSEPGACSETPKDPCVDVECDELPCPEDVQYTIGCCPECPADWGVPPCVISGTCAVEPTEDPDSCGKPCHRIYRPVCGSDGNTYANECLFEIEKCKNPELTSEPGTCSETPIVIDFCVDVECDELPCPEDVQYTIGCCPECPADWGVPPCVISGTCAVEPTEAIQDPCADTECDELTCPADLQHTYPGNCCPECPQDWGLDPCELSGTCTIRPTATIDPDSCGKPCHRIYRPVCGSDGNTYANECVFEIEKCKNPELTSEPGACSETPKDPCVDVECDELPCPEDVQYTIGCCPECPADWGVPPCVISGTCTVEPTEDPDSCGKPCHRIYRPVCGSDGNTYANECLFEIEKCKNPELTSEPGACSETPIVIDICVDVECDELPCPEDVQYTIGCCPRCPEDWGVPPCVISGTCRVEPTEDPCADTECDELTCPADLQHTYPGNCCPECPQDWGLDPCQLSGTCAIRPTAIIDEGGLSPPTDCNDIEALESGVYTVIPNEGEAVTVFCDFDTAHGPWTVIQRRQDGSVNFYRHMADYKTGFGNLEEEFWFGLDNIYRFVSQGSYQLRIDLQDGSGTSKFATYDDFSISDESDGYRLSIGRYSGNARNSLSYHNGMQFSTRDDDNDLNTKKSCAKFHKGAWWYKNCLRSNLNGRYRDPARKHPDGLIWANWRGYTESMRFVEMKIRRV